MIKPIYFPFTYVPQWVAEIFAAGFQHFYVYQPSGKGLPAEMQMWVEKKVLNVCVPVKADDKNFSEIVRAFQQFAQQHADVRSLKSAAFWNQQGAIPFFDDTSASQIVTHLKKGREPDTGPAQPEAILRARVFLEFAQEFDRQNAELQHELNDTNLHAEALLKNLSGRGDNEPALTRLTAELKSDDPGDYMPQDRLVAWIRLFLEKPVDSGFLVTSSPTIFNSLVENLVSDQKIFEINRLPALASDDDAFMDWREAFCQQIKSGVEAEVPFAENTLPHRPPLLRQAEQFKLSVCHLPEYTPAQLFARFLKLPNGDSNQFNQPPGIKNTLIGLIKRDP